ncbi:MAG: hypothetical protein WKG07_27635 [Hymenobacter sp.]
MCAAAAETGPLSITSPLSGTDYVLNRGEGQQLLLSCTTDSEVRQVYWYVNDAVSARRAGHGARVFPAAGGATENILRR